MSKIVGVVSDADSGEVLPYVNVYCKSAKQGAVTDDAGVFHLNIPLPALLDATCLGYAPASLKVASASDTIRIMLHPASFELSEVVVKPKKEKYSKKNNPAVDLVRRVREDRDKHNPVSALPYYSYNRYDKMLLALNDYTGYINADAPERDHKKSLAVLVDTAAWTGKRILDLSLKENYATRITTDYGRNDKEIIVARRNNGIDKSIDADFSRVFFEDIMREIDIYGNDISVMRTRFVSPLAAIGPDFYKYEITDTVLIGNDKCVEISFAPHNPATPGFNGKLFVHAGDSVKYVRRVVMRMPKAANVNYVENIIVNQTFDKDSAGFTHKVMDDMVVEMRVAGSVGRLYASRLSRYDNFSDSPHPLYNDYASKSGAIFELDDTDNQSIEFWQSHRMLPLSQAERVLAVDESPFRNIPWLYVATKAVEIIVKGYVATGSHSKFDFGGIDTFVSYNGLEGLRLSVGGLTTANLSPNLFARGYVAYGMRDHKWKFRTELEYSFNKKKYHTREFPMNGIRATIKYDVNNLGQHFMTAASNNLLNSFKREQTELTVYEGLARVEYNVEWLNHLSLNFNVQSKRVESTPFVRFEDAYGNNILHYNQSSLGVSLRFAPGEKFMQTYDERRSVNRDAWVFGVSHEIGPKHWFGSDYFINLTEMYVQKRIWFSAFGRFDILVKGAKLWNQVQFPALLWQNANLAYTIQRETFNLLNPMEFALDQYVSLDCHYNLNGLIFNNIPFVKKARLREVVSFRGFWGSLSRKNNPDFNPNLYRFPVGTGRLMGNTPYMEIGAGLANILTFLRLEYVWRLSYRDTPGAARHGLRFALEFAF